MARGLARVGVPPTPSLGIHGWARRGPERRGLRATHIQQWGALCFALLEGASPALCRSVGESAAGVIGLFVKSAMPAESRLTQRCASGSSSSGEDMAGGRTVLLSPDPVARGLETAAQRPGLARARDHRRGQLAFAGSIIAAGKVLDLLSLSRLRRR